MPTMTGFRHAPVSKGLIFATAGASILSQAARASRRTQLVPATLTHALVFRSPAELVFGTLLMYYFRLLEREAGPSKFAAFAAISTFLSSTLQWAVGRSGLLGPGLTAWEPSGPYGLIFACFIQYYFQVPAANKMVVLGWRLSDKVFVYVLGLQLLMSAGQASVLAGGTGLVAGLIYKFNVLRLKQLRFPRFVRRFFANTLGVLLSSDSPPPNQMTATGTAAMPGRTGAGAAPGSRRAGGHAATGGGTGAAIAGGDGAVPSAPHLPGPSRAAVEQLVAMGFGEAESIRALQLTNNDLQQAIGLLLNS